MRPDWLIKRNALNRKRGAKKQDVLESKVVKATVKAATAAGFLHRKVVYAGRAGAPDDWFFGYDHQLIIIEFKAPGKEPKPHQAEEVAALRRRGFEVYVVDNVADGQAIFAGRGQW